MTPLSESQAQRTAALRGVMRGDNSLKRLADALSRKNTSTVQRRWGTVDHVNAEDSTVDVLIGVTVIPHLQHAAWYTPTEGDRVQLDIVGTDIIVVGTTA